MHDDGVVACNNFRILRFRKVEFDRQKDEIITSHFYQFLKS